MKIIERQVTKKDIYELISIYSDYIYDYMEIIKPFKVLEIKNIGKIIVFDDSELDTDMSGLTNPTAKIGFSGINFALHELSHLIGGKYHTLMYKSQIDKEQDAFSYEWYKRHKTIMNKVEQEAWNTAKKLFKLRLTSSIFSADIR